MTATAEETEQRRSEDRLRTIARRNNMTAEETEVRSERIELRTNGKDLANMTVKETEQRRSEDRLLNNCKTEIP
ncbi:hypothetical protein AVEN_275044-1 [Araneus ventricosus]|uniref:Uncharacterized protein n=1 Tax=Araneus ventricosus TaxID=182803 RepID=A0A4Y2EVS4_ARAVE|nr:hypothetical protein AVEN_275044-1 [Araneus ventricosus]